MELDAGPLVLAHPLTEAVILPIAPLAVAGLTACLVVAAASFGAVSPAPIPALRRTSAEPLSAAEIAVRTVAVALLALSVVAGRIGTTVPSRNIAPILLVAAGLPLVVLASVALGPVWARIDPLDALARLLRAPDAGDAPDLPGVEDARTAEATPRVRHVWPATVPALAGVMYLTVYPDGLRPQTLGAVVAAYALLTLAGCLALGRRRWLEQVEVVGLVLTWFGGLRGRRLVGWSPPPGAAAVLGIVAGGLVFGLLRGSSLYVDAAFAVGLRGADYGGVLLFAVVGALLIALPEWRRGDGTVTAGAVPVVAAIVLVFTLRDARAILAVDLLPGLLIDPFGRGWSVGGVGQREARALPFDVAALALGQLAVLVAGGLAAARVIRGRSTGRGRIAPAVSVAVLLVMAGVLAVTTA